MIFHNQKFDFINLFIFFSFHRTFLQILIQAQFGGELPDKRKRYVPINVAPAALLISDWIKNKVFRNKLKYFFNLYSN